MNSKVSPGDEREVTIPIILFSNVPYPYSGVPSNIQLPDLPQMQQIPTDPFKVHPQRKEPLFMKPPKYLKDSWWVHGSLRPHAANLFLIVLLLTLYFPLTTMI